MSDEEKLVSHYRLKTLLRKDGFGAVYFAEDTRDQKTCILRVIELDHATLTRITGRVRAHAQRDHPLIEQIRQRMKRISELKNTHVLPVIEFGEEHIQGNNDIIFYMVSPYEKESLLSYWSARTSGEELLALEIVSELIFQAAEGLYYVHRRGLVHQYVRLSSFMLHETARSHKFHLYLTDFWFADISAAILEEGQISQDLSVYLAAEQLAGHAVASSDQYALAILAYELLLGYRLSQVDLSLGLYERFINQRGVVVSEAELALARRLDLVLARALAEDASARFSNIEEFALMFRAVASGELLELDEDTAKIQAIVHPQRKKSQATESAAAAAAALIAGEVVEEITERRVEIDESFQSRHPTLHKTVLTSEGMELTESERVESLSTSSEAAVVGGAALSGAVLASEETITIDETRTIVEERETRSGAGAAGFVAGLAAGELSAEQRRTSAEGAAFAAGEAHQREIDRAEEETLLAGDAAAAFAAGLAAGEARQRELDLAEEKTEKRQSGAAAFAAGAVLGGAAGLLAGEALEAEQSGAFSAEQTQHTSSASAAGGAALYEQETDISAERTQIIEAGGAAAGGAMLYEREIDITEERTQIIGAGGASEAVLYEQETDIAEEKTQIIPAAGGILLAGAAGLVAGELLAGGLGGVEGAGGVGAAGAGGVSAGGVSGAGTGAGATGGSGGAGAGVAGVGSGNAGTGIGGVAGSAGGSGGYAGAEGATAVGGLSVLEEAELIGGAAAAGLAAAGLAAESGLIGGGAAGAGAGGGSGAGTGAGAVGVGSGSTGAGAGAGVSGNGQGAETGAAGAGQSGETGGASEIVGLGILGAAAGLVATGLVAEEAAAIETAELAGGAAGAGAGLAAGGIAGAGAAGAAGGVAGAGTGAAAGGVAGSGVGAAGGLAGAGAGTAGGVAGVGTGAAGTAAGGAAGVGAGAAAGGLAGAGAAGGVAGGGLFPTPVQGGGSGRPRRGRTLLAAIILALLLLLVFGGVVAYALNLSQSSATVTLTLQSHTVRNTYLITATTNTTTTTTTTTSGQVQATFLTQSASLSQGGQATGYFPGVEASGFIKLSNNSTGCGCPIFIPAGTPFVSGSGVTVVIDYGVSVASLCSVTVPAHAMIYGSGGDIAAGNVQAAYNSHIFATNPYAFTGGQGGQSNALVQQSDIDHVAGALKTQVLQSAQTGLQAQLQGNQRLSAQPTCKTKVQSNHPAGDNASSFNVIVSTVCNAEAYDYTSAMQIVQQQAQSVASSYSSDQYTLVGGLQTSVSSATITDAKAGTVLLAFTVVGRWLHKLSNGLERYIAGKSVADARAILQQFGAAQVNISLSGFNASTLPSDSSRIKLVVKS